MVSDTLKPNLQICLTAIEKKLTKTQDGKPNKLAPFWVFPVPIFFD